MASNKNHLTPTPSPTGIYAHIVGWGMAVPDNIMTNDDMASIVETNDEWIHSRTGIRERRIATEKESTATLGYRAAQRALEVADILPVDIDLIIVATSTPEHIFPSTASLIQDWLGASKAGGFDLSAACSGFVYALNMAAQSIKSGSIQTAVVIGAETMSRVLDWQDRGTCILFGDGAGAVVLRASTQQGGILSSVLRSDGGGADLLCIPTNNVRDLNGHKVQKMFMVGSEVFKFATRVVNQSIREAVDLAGIQLEDIDLIVPHQANLRILQSAARKLKIDLDRFMSNVDRYGNTSAASIPIALCEAVEQGKIHDNDYLAFVGFGGGLSWASMVLQWGVPEPEQHTTRLGQQRRQLSYTLARWRNRINKLRRNVSQFFNRIRPNAGRIFRLQRKIEQDEIL
jgi:3-oxoacyl-[acyl-carrier-protein] synthase III